ncbi:hypothetical protein [Haloarcula pellucida]|uniref:Uncharacterized protein n=1 Tax=Haloarcula pellucida TaxID=1427151 RepID=A0A830GFA0_9EURY|nr:hypothetical protein [Halomicroarcula pellucida]MBX0346607.1 hypothetical protein [Halomicroarcula pellucida]GGN84541.1 hypothetical protein GCM10009030_00250 [Halomicroarcula pellucida]
MPSSARQRVEDRPDSILGGMFWDWGRRFRAVSVHLHAEGGDVHPRAVIEGYDRALHPIMHGRRPHDIAQKVREVFSL